MSHVANIGHSRITALSLRIGFSPDPRRCIASSLLHDGGVARSVRFLAEIASGISHLGRIYCYYERLTKGFLLTTSVCVRNVDYERGRHVSSHFCSTASHLDVALLTLGTEGYNVTYKA